MMNVSQRIPIPARYVPSEYYMRSSQIANRIPPTGRGSFSRVCEVNGLPEKLSYSPKSTVLFVAFVIGLRRWTGLLPPVRWTVLISPTRIRRSAAVPTTVANKALNRGGEVGWFRDGELFVAARFRKSGIPTYGFEPRQETCPDCSVTKIRP
jgi:hypothetical protein